MNEIVLFAASMPIFVVYTIAGALGGVLGGGAGLIAEKYFGLKKGWRYVPFAVFSVNVSQRLFEDAVPAQAVSTLKQNRLAGVIFKYHPGAEQEYVARYKKILSGPREKVSAESRALAADFTGRYLNLHMPTASDAAIHRLLQTEASTLEALKNNPAECVAQYLGTPSASRLEATPRSLVEESLNAKAEIIESSVVTPSPPPKIAKIDDIAGVIADAYRAKGYDTAEIAKIGNVQLLPPDEGCQVSYRFVSALASMNEKQSAFVYKGLLSAAK
jgi:hypothetical protein